jgi:hypothetical protein
MKVPFVLKPAVEERKVYIGCEMYNALAPKEFDSEFDAAASIVRAKIADLIDTQNLYDFSIHYAADLIIAARDNVIEWLTALEEISKK